MASSSKDLKTTPANSTNPTYGFLIDLFEDCDGNVELLCTKFEKQFPDVYIGRPQRFFETIVRIIGPTRSTAIGGPKLVGSSLASYRQRIWTPRLRNMPQCVVLPTELSCYGLDEEKLLTVWHSVSSTGSGEWSVRGVPNVGFYRSLHNFLRKWHVTKNSTKSSVGRFYLSIDKNLEQKGGRPDNIYRFIERVVQSSRSSAEIMIYPCEVRETEVKVKESRETQVELKECTAIIDTLRSELSSIKERYEVANKYLQSASSALKDVTNQNVKLKSIAEKKTRQICKLESEYDCLFEELLDTEECNSDQAAMIDTLEKQLSEELSENDVNFETKTGQKFSPAVRKLYYTLLANEVPVSRVADIVKSVVKCFNPMVNVNQLKLPQKSCASYMRKDELKTVSDAHKATVLTEQVKNGFRLNTDGTTKFQKKLGGVAINNVVLAVNELADGKAETAIDDVSKQLESLRQVAHDLQLPNADRLNWTLIVSSSSDSASTQKKFNRLVEDRRKFDEERFGQATMETMELVETFCGMHLGVNLRKAFLSGIVCDGQERYHPVDCIVHEFCKLFGKTGVPEYGVGVNFQDYLLLMSKDTTLSHEEKVYYELCCDVRLERQVGSRYFVTASNAVKLIFLRKAAISFLQYTSKSEAGNKLEKDVYSKLQDSDLFELVICDALMYYHIYADLVVLAKSKDLKKSVLDMNSHYHELYLFLEEVENNPEIVCDKEHKVFKSEEKLYGDSKKLNHRRHRNCTVLYDTLFSQASQCKCLHVYLKAGSVLMKEKLSTYAESQLPGGKFWDPDPSTRKILTTLAPSNDLCESILGLNDYLTTSIPNLHQVSRSNLVQVKKNSTVKWLDNLPSEQQIKVLDYAYSQRKEVSSEYKAAEKARAEARQQSMVDAHQRREALKRKAQLEKEHLSKQYLITTSVELEEAFRAIDNEKVSASKKKMMKQNLLKTQINIRRKVLGQNVRIFFSNRGKKRSVEDVMSDLAAYIDQTSESDDLSSTCGMDARSLVNKQIQHRFQLEDGNSEWFNGTVLNYDETLNAHEIIYEGETEHCFFNLVVDLLNGDLKVLD